MKPPLRSRSLAPRVDPLVLFAELSNKRMQLSARGL
jgi:hypothetical protein